MIRTCSLCEHIIPPQYVLCRRCFHQYKQYIHEPWFQALVDMQVRQDYISHKEAHYLTEGIEQQTLQTHPKFTRSPGRPRKLTAAQSREILTAYAQSVADGKRLSFRALARLYHCNRMTIQRLIHTYGNADMLTLLATADDEYIEEGTHTCATSTD